MAENQNNANLITRIIESHAPCSVVIDNEQEDIHRFVDQFISNNKDELEASSIIPIRIDCSLVTDKVSFWKLIAEQIKTSVPPDFEWDEEAEDEWDRINDSHNTFFLKESLVTIAKIYNEQTNYRFLLIFEQFESAIEVMDMQDSLKVRDLTKTFVLLAVTRASLKSLGEGKVNNIYYCNQFETYKNS